MRVRFAPKATELMRHNKTSLCANGVLMHRSSRTALFDHLVGEQQERLSNRQAESFGRFKIDYKFKFFR